MAAFYARFDFRAVRREDLPPTLAQMHRLANLIAAMSAPLRDHRVRIIAMRRNR